MGAVVTFSPMLAYHDEMMRRELQVLVKRVPADVFDLADFVADPMDDPLCGVCTILIPTIERPPNGDGRAQAAADRLWCYHAAPRDLINLDAAMHGDDYLLDTGLQGVHEFMRCRKLYRAALDLILGDRVLRGHWRSRG